MSWQNSDGTRTAALFGAPVNYVNAQNQWTATDTRLGAGQDGDVTPAALPVRVDFAHASSADKVVSLTDSKGASVDAGFSGVGTNEAIKTPAAEGRQPVIDSGTTKSSLTYGSVLDNTDLRYDVTGSAIKQWLVLNQPLGPSVGTTFRFPLTLHGLAASVTDDGQVALKDAAGKAVVTIPAGYAADSSDTDGNGDPSYSPLTMALDTQGDHTTLLVTVDAQWLNDPARVYPVSIDPSYTYNATSDDDANTQQQTPTTNYNGSSQYVSSCTCYRDRAGHVSAVDWYAYLHYSGLSALNGKDIISATWKGFALGASTLPSAWTIQPVSSSWSAGTVTYTGQPSLFSNNATGTISTAGTWQTASITSWVQNWADGTWTNNGVYISGPSTTADNFAADENGSSTQSYINVTYNSIPDVPTTPELNNVPRTSINTTTPELSTVVSDLDGGNLHADYEIWNSSHTGSAIVTGTGSSHYTGTRSRWTVPSGNLSTGTTYSYRYRGDDGTDTSAWSAWQTLTVDTTAPNAPGVSSSTWTANTWNSSAPTSGPLAFTNGGSSDVVGYFYGLDKGDNPSNYTTGTSATIYPNAGWHTVSVRSQDAAGNVSPVTHFTFGNGAGGFVTPSPDTASGQNFLLTLNSDPTYDGVKIQYRHSESDTWTTLPTSDVKYQSSGIGIGSWTVSCTPSGSCGSTTHDYPALIWNAASTLGSPGPVQLRGDYYTGSTNSNVYTNVLNLIFDPNQFSGTYANAQVGPGSVNLLTGNYALSSMDVSVQGLGLSRTFNSLDQNNSTSFFGPGWTSTATPRDLTYRTLTDNGTDVVITDASGGIYTFRQQTNGTYVSEHGSSDLTLVKCNSGGTTCDVNTNGRFELKLLNSATWGFESPGSGVSDYAVVDVTDATGQTGSTTWTVASGIAEPTREVAAAPTGVNCSSAPLTTDGCHSLAFTYGSSTTASGISESDWGDYSNQLKTISYTAWDPNKSGGAGMSTIDVASYLYDINGYLRAEWDPRVSPALKTKYSYNSDGQIATITPPGVQPWTLKYSPLSIEPPGTGRLSSVQRPTLNSSGVVNGTATTSVVYQIPLSTGAGGPYNMTPSDTAAWAQTDNATDATAIYPPDQTPSGSPPSSYTRATIHYLDVNGQEVNTAEPGGEISTTEFDSSGKAIRTLTAGNRAAALASSSTLADQAAMAVQLDNQAVHDATDSVVTDRYGPAHDVILPNGSVIVARHHVHTDYDQGSPGGATYDLPTTVTDSASPIDGSSEVDSRVTSNTYSIGSDNSGWTLGTPLQVTVDPGSGAHLDLTTTTLYDSTGALTARRLPGNSSGGDAHETDFVYYTAGTNSQDSACGNKPEWATLVCTIGPAAQPGGSLPNIPVERVTAYNMWQEPLTTVDTSGSITRTTTLGYDSAGRSTTDDVDSTLSGTQDIPQNTISYDTSTGIPTTLTDGALTITHTYDSLGRLTSYTDADGNTSTYTYDSLDRVATSNDGKVTTTYAYDTSIDPRGVLTSTSDAGVGAFSATYDADGQIATQTDPGGLTASYSYDSTDTPVGLSYDRSGTSWITEQQLANIHGEVVTHSSQLSSQTYTYDAAARLAQVADTVNGQGCVIRSYSFDADSNRLGLNTQQPNPDDSCPTPTSVTTTNSYDAADRVTNTGYTYDALGRTVAIPASDVPNGASTTTGYFVNDLAYQITQGSSSRTYALDPARRYRSWTDGTTTHTNHYSGDSDSPSWTNESATTWKRDVQAFGGLRAIETNVSGTSTVMLEISNLHGDVVAEDAPSDTTLAATAADTTEYGLARSGVGQRYDYLGTSQRARDNLSGLTLMGSRIYDASTGRFESVDPVVGGGANAYVYTDGDPVNSSDAAGTSTFPENVAWTALQHSKIWSHMSGLYYQWQHGPYPGWTEWFPDIPSSFCVPFPGAYPLVCGVAHILHLGYQEWDIDYGNTNNEYHSPQQISVQFYLRSLMYRFDGFCVAASHLCFPGVATFEFKDPFYFDEDYHGMVVDVNWSGIPGIANGHQQLKEGYYGW